MEAQSAASLVFVFALLNAWLARRRDRSAARWFVGSLLLPPFVWLLTLYLLTRSERPAAATTPSPAWGWIKLVAVAGAAVLLVFAVFVNVAGRPQGGAVATTQPQPVQTP
jgi:Na+/proline symporter